MSDSTHDLPMASQPANPQQIPITEQATVGLDAQSTVTGASVPRAFGDYELLEEIARGGMGVVWKARQIRLNRTVALKMILSGEFASAADVRRFRGEAEAAALLDHPHIVRIHEVGEHSGQHFFSMAFIEGGNLAQRMEEYQLPPPEQPAAEIQARQRKIAQLLVQVARAVHDAHQHGILHRDLKPANILLDARGEPHVSDFGLAKRVEGQSQLTATGAILGTPSYMAPEQANAKRALTIAADVYSLGAILYELLTGRPPFQGESPLETLLQAQQREPDRPRSLHPKMDRDVETICLKCLHKEPAGRYASAEELACDLERWLEGEPIRARPAGRWERGVKWARRRPTAAALFVVSAVSLVCLLVLAGFLWRNAEERAAAVQDLRIAQQQEQAAEVQAGQLQRVADEIRGEVRLQEKRLREAQDAARRAVYTADMQFAHGAWSADNLPRMISLLERHRPQKDQQDIRGFEWHYLWRLCHGERLTFSLYPQRNPAAGTSSSDRPILLAFSPDGKMLATASLDEPIRLWDQATGKLLHTLPKPAAGATSLAFSEDGKYLEIVTPKPSQGTGFGNVGKLVNALRAGAAKPSLQGLLATLTKQTFALDGRQAPAVEPFQPERLKGSVNVIMAGTAGMIGPMVGGIIPLKGRVLSPICLALAPDRQTLAVGGIVTPIPFLPGKQVQEGAVLLWDLGTGTEKAVLTGHKDPVNFLAFAPDGRTLVSGGLDGSIILWDLQAPTPQRISPPAMERAHASAVMSLVFSADGKRFASAGIDGRVMVRDARTGRVQMACKGHVNPVTSVAFSADEKMLASVGMDGSIKLWDLTRAQEPLSLAGFEMAIAALAFSTDGTQLFTVDHGGHLKVCDPRTGQVRTSRSLQGSRMFLPKISVTSAALAPDGKTLAVGEVNNTVRLYDWDTGKQLHALKTPPGVVFSLAFSPDGAILAASTGEAGRAGAVRLWDARTGKERHTLAGHGNRVLCVAFSPDGRLLASGCGDKTVRLWDVATGALYRLLPAYGAEVSCLRFSPDGRLLAVAHGDQVTIHDATTGQEKSTFPVYQQQVVSMAFSPDGTRLVTAGGSGETGIGGGVKVWDLATGQEMLTLGGATDLVSCVAFSPDGRRLASSRSLGGSIMPYSAAATGEVTIWNATPPEQTVPAPSK
jgi:WD40 repeat protein